MSRNLLKTKKEEKEIIEENQEEINKLREGILENGLHFGSSIKTLNTTMKDSVILISNKQCFFDIESIIKRFMSLVSKISKENKHGKIILITSNKEEHRDQIRELANHFGQPFCIKPTPGILTNLYTVAGKSTNLEELKKEIEDPEAEIVFTKKELSKKKRLYDKLNKKFEGIRSSNHNNKLSNGLNRVPDFLLCFQGSSEDTIVKEAIKLKIPVGGFFDSSSNVEDIEYFVPSNNSSKQSFSFCVDKILEASKNITKDEKEKKVNQDTAKRKVLTLK